MVKIFKNKILNLLQINLTDKLELKSDDKVLLNLHKKKVGKVVDIFGNDVDKKVLDRILAEISKRNY